MNLYAQIWVHKPKVVFSSALEQSNWNTRVVPGGVMEEVEKLKAESTSDRLLGMRRFAIGTVELRYARANSAARP